MNIIPLLVAIFAASAATGYSQQFDTDIPSLLGGTKSLTQPAPAAAPVAARPESRPASEKAAPQKVSLKLVSEILAAGRLPGGCALEANEFRPSSHPPITNDTLNLTISKAGNYADIFIIGSADFSREAAGGVYRYELVSTQGADWLDSRVKDVFELRTDSTNRAVAVTIEKYKEKKTVFGGLEWKMTETVSCRK